MIKEVTINKTRGYGYMVVLKTNKVKWFASMKDAIQYSAIIQHECVRIKPVYTASQLDKVHYAEKTGDVL